MKRFKLIISLAVVILLVTACGKQLQVDEKAAPKQQKKHCKCKTRNGAIPSTCKKLFSEQEVKIVFLGDSLTEKNFHTHNKDNYVDMLEDYFIEINPKTKIVNSGISGSTTRDSLKRLKRDVLDHNPDLTFVMLGGNDCSSWFNVGLDEFQANLREIIGQIQDIDSEIILMTECAFQDNAYDGKVTFTDYELYEQAIVDIAAELKLPVIDNFTVWSRIKAEDVERFNSYMNNWIHPNHEGHVFFYQTIKQHLDEWLKK